ncbi:RNA-processing protein [Candidatus Woesearchaeota archaeon]|nr:RNA-processing protein [Candidatus Woesearchaeota archaeon]MBT4321772.1 RNA-processing protein [Candidatus Woesearchaeota archaeon]MBT4630903.1 RNA-processing protein [Candidatus Woesearchaeota archaeon]
MSEELKIPKDRVAVLIGEKGSTKRKIQKLTNTKITVSSKEGDVLIEGEDNYRIFVTGNIVRAIGRGFNPNIALKLLKEDYALDMIGINEFSGKSKKQEERIKSRAIGTDGKARRTLEKMTNTNICIYGKTIGIIGPMEDVYLAKRSLTKLLQGSPHTTVYKFIDREKEKQETL